MKNYSIQVQRSAAWLLAAIFLIGCAVGSKAPEPENLNTIEGTVWYRERMLLPPDAEVIVTLEDVSRMDVKSKLIAETRFTPKGGPPFSFTFFYDPAKIHDKGRYALRARIQLDDKLVFTSTQHIPAFDRDSSQPVKILVYRVSGTNT